MNKASKIIISVLVLAALAGVIFFFQNSANKSTPSVSNVKIPEGWKQYKNEKIGYSFIYPEEYKLTVVAGKDGNKQIPMSELVQEVVLGKNDSESIMYNMFAISVDINPEGLSIREFDKRQGATFSEVEAREDAIINGAKARTSSHTGSKLFMGSVTISSHGKIVDLSYNNFKTVPNVKNIFETMMNSIVITE